MKANHLLKGLGLLFCSFFFWLSCVESTKDVTNEITEMNKVLMESFQKNELPAVLDLYAENAKIFPANSEIIDGKSAIEGFWKNVSGMGIKAVQFETVKAESTGNLAVEEGNYKLLVEGGHVVDFGKYLVTWLKIDGKWQITRDIWNSNAPAVVQRGIAKDTVWIISNPIKPDKVSQFEQFNAEILWPAGKELSPNNSNTVRMFKAVNQNKSGSYSYFYMMDPVTGGKKEAYDIYHILETKYGIEKSAEYKKMFNDCFASEQSTLVEAVVIY